jgi:putative glutamine amidotransferase
MIQEGGSMKKIVLFIIPLLLLSGVVWNCERKVEEVPVFDNQLVLINPGRGYLSSVLSMMEEKIIDLESTELVVVHYAPLRHQHESLQEFLEANPKNYVRQELIEGHLDESNLFQENPCTESFTRIFSESDGIFFFGGADFPPSIYGEKTDLLTSIATPFRHYFELSFLFHLLGGNQNPDYKPLLEENPDYVIRGFCLGMQSINVATGGTMIQDIPSEVYGMQYVEDVLEQHADERHKNYWNNLAPRENLFWCNFHRIRFIEEEFFTEVMQLDPSFTPYVCSSHHQAAEMIGKNLRVAATSMDGEIIEALTHERYPNVVGVQFHPEAFSIFDPDANEHKLSPADTLLLSENGFKRDKSLEFHKAFWSQFSEAFMKSAEK